MKLESDSLLLSSEETADFLKKICEKGLRFKFTAKGMSMSPFICDGDAVEIEPVAQGRRMGKGDIAAYINPDRGHLILHRIVGQDKNRFLLKGDNIFQCDGYCDKKDIHGCVTKIVRAKKDIHMLPALVRQVFFFLNPFKKTIAFLSYHKLLTPVCRVANRLMRAGG